MENRRIDYLDICKGILIILVVIGHAVEIVDLEYQSYLIKLIYSFHMPAFFIISGFLYNAEKWKKKGFKEYLINRINRNLIPYFFFEYLYGIIASLFIYGLNWKGKIMELLYVFKGAFSVEVHYIPSWFLITLFFAGLMLYWLESSNKKLIVIETLILIIISIIGCRILDGMEEGFVRNILIFVSRIAISSVFMLIGVLWRRFDTSRINKPVVTVNCLIVTALFPYL